MHGTTIKIKKFNYTINLLQLVKPKGFWR